SANALEGTTSTDALGRYSFDNLDSGEYKVTATLPGFRAASADLRADAGGRQQDFTMAVAGLGETITVAGQAPVLDSFRTAQAEAAAPALAMPFAPIAGPTGRGGGRGGGVFGDGVYRGRTVQPPRNTESYARLDEAGFVRVSQ